ncbi:hypothetical protein GCM10027567_25690 [Spongiibacter taiwanensis]
MVISGLFTQFIAQRLTLLIKHISNDDHGAFFHKSPRNGRADTAGASRNDGELIGQAMRAFHGQELISGRLDM